MKHAGGFEKLLRKPEFVERVVNVVFDEAHCISTWAIFRPEYQALERLRHVILEEIPVAAASATLPHTVKEDVMKTLHMQPEKTVHIARPTDRPDVHLAVRKIEYPLSSYLDLAFVLPASPELQPPPKFIIFFDNITEAVEACITLRNRLPPEHAHKFAWFHSEMTEAYKRSVVEKLTRGDLWGIFATDSFGMVSAFIYCCVER